MSGVRDFLRHHYRHFNAAALVDAADGYTRHIDQGGKMFMTLAGAMSTAELGLSLAEMIRRGKVHGISCTGANLEEDLFNLVAHDHYVRVPHYRELIATRRRSAARAAPESRDGYVHSGRGSDSPHRSRDRRGMDRGRPRRDSVISRTSSCTDDPLAGRSRSSFQIDPKDSWLSPRASATCRSSCRAGKTRRSATSSPRTSINGDITQRAHGAHRHRIHDRARAVVSPRIGRSVDRVLPDRRRHRRRLSDLRGADAAAGSADAGHSALGLFLSDQRFDDQLRLVLRRRCRMKRSRGASSTPDTPKYIIESDATHRRAADLRERPRRVNTVDAAEGSRHDHRERSRSNHGPGLVGHERGRAVRGATWGDGFFFVNEAGHAAVRPLLGPDLTIDILEVRRRRGEARRPVAAAAASGSRTCCAPACGG